MNAAFIAHQWSTLCDSAHTNVSRLSEGLSDAAIELMQAELDRFCALDPPQDKSALHAAYTQRMALSARLTAISRADAMARVHPGSAANILAEVGRFCDGDLPADDDDFLEMQRSNIELTETVADLCEAGSIGRPS